MQKATTRLMVLQRVCPAYRKGLFEKLAREPDLQLRLVVGDDLTGTKVQNASTPPAVDRIQLPTMQMKVGGRTLVYHRGLRRALKDFAPDVILCEGESHILGYVQAIRYARRRPNVNLIHWGGGRIPGESRRSRGIGRRLAHWLQKKADHFLVYSSYARASMMAVGHPTEKITVAVNVCDTNHHQQMVRNSRLTRSEARSTLRLPDVFTVLYVGSLDENKKPDKVLEIARLLNSDNFSFVIVGGGSMYELLYNTVQREGLHNVSVVGPQSERFAHYLSAGDVMLVPGRGGMVVSEAMVWGLPVIVHAADGTERDLVIDDQTGWVVPDDHASTLAAAIAKLSTNPDLANRMGTNAQRRIQGLGTEQMVQQVKAAIAASKNGGH